MLNEKTEISMTMMYAEINSAFDKNLESLRNTINIRIHPKVGEDIAMKDDDNSTDQFTQCAINIMSKVSSDL